LPRALARSWALPRGGRSRAAGGLAASSCARRRGLAGPLQVRPVHRAIHQVHERNEEPRVEDRQKQASRDRLLVVQDAEREEDERPEEQRSPADPLPRGRIDLPDRPAAALTLADGLRAVAARALSLRLLGLGWIDVDRVALVVDVEELVVVRALLLPSPPLFPRSHAGKA